MVWSYNDNPCLKEIVIIRECNVEYMFKKEELLVLNKVLKISREKRFSELQSFVFSTYPILFTKNGLDIDLSSLAKDYKNQATNLTLNLLIYEFFKR